MLVYQKIQILKVKNNIKKATPITKEKITESMILYENHKQNL